jgi:hypothetical protein
VVASIYCTIKRSSPDWDGVNNLEWVERTCVNIALKLKGGSYITLLQLQKRMEHI